MEKGKKKVFDQIPHFKKKKFSLALEKVPWFLMLRGAIKGSMLNLPTEGFLKKKKLEPLPSKELLMYPLF